MRRLLSIVAVAVLLAHFGAGEVAADHGYWPAGGVDPAVVSGHEPRTADNSSASAWGSDCVTLAASASGARTLDVYGHVVQADYELAVVMAQIEGVPIDGPNGLTVFTDVKSGQFLWADADGDGRYAGEHEADAGELYLCGPLVPSTDTLHEESLSTTPAAWSLWAAALLFTVAVVALLASLGQRARRR